MLCLPKFDAVEGQEDSKAEEVATVETDCLSRARVAQIFLREQSQGPTVHSDVCTRQAVEMRRLLIPVHDTPYKKVARSATHLASQQKGQARKR